jgi:hypothetical protein
VQTLGLSHALTSFMWLCGPIAGLVVSTGRSHSSLTPRLGSLAVIFTTDFTAPYLAYNPSASAPAGPTAGWPVQRQVYIEMGETEAVYPDRVHAHLRCREFIGGAATTAWSPLFTVVVVVAAVYRFPVNVFQFICRVHIGHCCRILVRHRSCSRGHEGTLQVTKNCFALPSAHLGPGGLPLCIDIVLSVT